MPKKRYDKPIEIPIRYEELKKSPNVEETIREKINKVAKGERLRRRSAKSARRSRDISRDIDKATLHIKYPRRLGPASRAHVLDLDLAASDPEAGSVIYDVFERKAPIDEGTDLRKSRAEKYLESKPRRPKIPKKPPFKLRGKLGRALGLAQKIYRRIK